jgi:hypothetical protein
LTLTPIAFSSGCLTALRMLIASTKLSSGTQKPLGQSGLSDFAHAAGEPSETFIALHTGSIAGSALFSRSRCRIRQTARLPAVRCSASTRCCGVRGRSRP